MTENDRIKEADNFIFAPQFFMHRTLLIVFFLFLGLGAGFAQDEGIRQLMNKRVVSYEDMSYNAVLLIPLLHKEKKTDTLHALLNFIQENYGSAPVIVPYIILDQIKKRSFREEIKNVWVDSTKESGRNFSDSEYYRANLFSYYLSWYNDNFHIADDQRYPLYLRKAYGDYFTFLSDLSKDLLATNDLSAVEKWLLHYFMNPDDNLMQQPGEKDFEGTGLRKSWAPYRAHQNSVAGGGLSLAAGVWSPTGKLNIVGSHPSLGYTVGAGMKNLFLT